MANNNIQIYSVYNHISLINLCLNYIYWNEFNSKDPNGPLKTAVGARNNDKTESVTMDML
jgi:hypothetical protein